MQAIRKILKVENNKLQIDLPENLFTGLVEVIILPFKNPKTNVEKKSSLQQGNKQPYNDFQKLLLSFPTMNQEDEQFFKEKKDHFNQWK